MSFKFILFIGLVVLGSIEAHHFLKKVQKRDLTSKLSPRPPQKAYNALVRNRRDTEEESSNSTSSEDTNDDSAALVKLFVGIAWKGDKEEVLASFLEELSDHTDNITVIGWQRVLDSEGRVKEVVSVQFVISPKPIDLPNNIVEDDDDDDEDDDTADILPHKEIAEIREYLVPLTLIGVPASSTIEKFDSEGEPEVVAYLDKDELYVHAEGFSVYNKTSTATAQEVSNFIASLKPGALGKPSVVKYVDGKFDGSQSHIRPHILGFVDDNHEASDDILLKSPEIIAEISQQYPQEEIAKQLVLHYDQVFNDYKWRVLVDAEETYVTRDVSVSLSYDNFDLEDKSGTEYYVYGVNKTNVAQ